VAEAYLRADSLEQATDAAKQAMRNEDSARALDLMGRILSRRKAWIRNAPAYFRKTFAKDESFIDALYHLAQFHHQMGNEDEESALRDVIKEDPTYAQAYLDLGRFLFDRGENEQIKSAFESYVGLRPESSDGYYGLAVLATEDRNYETALQHGQTMMSVSDEDPRGYAVTAQALAARG
jgi:tetratricopeptide (TPR) repeat protein